MPHIWRTLKQCLLGREKRPPKVKPVDISNFLDLEDKAVEERLFQDLQPSLDKKDSFAALDKGRLCATLKSLYANNQLKTAQSDSERDFLRQYLRGSSSPLRKEAATRPFLKREGGDFDAVQNWFKLLEDDEKSNVLATLDVLVSRDQQRFENDSHPLADVKVFSEDTINSVRDFCDKVTVPAFVSELEGSGYDTVKWSLDQVHLALEQLSQLRGSTNTVFQQQKMREIRQHMMFCCEMMQDVASGYVHASASMKQEAQTFFKKYALLLDSLKIKKELDCEPVSQEQIERDRNTYFKVSLGLSKEPLADMPPVSKEVLDKAISYFASRGYLIELRREGDCYIVQFKSEYRNNHFANAYMMRDMESGQKAFVNMLRKLATEDQKKKAKSASVSGGFKSDDEEAASAAGSLPSVPTDDKSTDRRPALC